MAIMAIIFAVVLPQFRVVHNTWDSKAGAAETIQNGRVLIDHLNRNLSKAVKITAVSNLSATNGYIEFEDNDASSFRYDVNSVNDYVEYGPIGSLADLAGPVSKFQITCYDASDLDTPLVPVTDPSLIRLVKVKTTLTNSAGMGQDKTFSTCCYIRTNCGAGGTGLVGWWKLDEASGLTAADSSGNGNDGTLINMAGNEWTGGALGGALELDGSNNYVDCGNNSSLDITDEITLSVWVKTNDTGNGQNNPYVQKGDHSYGIKHYYYSEDKIQFFIYDGTWYTASTPMDSSFNDDWHHLAGTYDGSQIKLYIDGVLEATTDHVGAIASSTYDINIGRNSELTDRFYEGLIDDVRIYNRALEPEEIADLYNILRYIDFTEAKAASDTTSITISTPETNEGDLLIAAVATDGSTSASISPPFGEGWTEIDIDNFAFAVTLGAWWKLADVSESSSHQFTWSGSQKAYGWMMRFVGHDSTFPINDFTAFGIVSNSPDSPAVTTTMDGCLILRLGAFDDDDITVDNPGLSGHTAITMDKTTPSGTGLKADYYDNDDFTNLMVTRTDLTVDFDWGSGAPDPSMGVDTFSVRWTGYVKPLYSETYTFKTFSDDGDRVWVDNQLLIDDWKIQHGPGTEEGTIALTAGQMYDIKVEFYDNTSNAKINLYWSSLSQGEEIIPQSQLYVSIDDIAGTVSGGAGYIRQPSSGGSGTSEFSLGSSNQAQMLTIAIAPANQGGYGGGGISP